MTFYIGSQQELALVAFNKDSPSFHTKPLSEADENIYRQLSMPNILYFGSDQGCGCGFRHALLQGEEWFITEDENETSSQSVQENHQRLYEYLKSTISPNTKVEIYGCWAGNLTEPAMQAEEINVEELTDKDFYFREQTLYTITCGG